MSIRSNILRELEKNKGTSISGARLAESLNVSRTAIWKHIEDLRKEGYNISALSNKGYCLSPTTDLISAEGIIPYLNTPYSTTSIYTFKTLESTNETAKELALNGASHGTIVISEEQTAGKGRLGRKFYSPSNSGIYMSIILRPNLKISDAVLITTAASVAICNAIENVTNTNVKIKWINDIVINDKKVCGILTEAVTDFETGNIQHLILGIGINFNTSENDFPIEIRNLATSIFSNTDTTSTRNQLCAEVINKILFMIEDIKNYDFIDEYKKRSIILNQDITFIRGGISTKGRAIDINDDGSLVVKKENNEIVTLNSGEVSIRRII